MTRPLTANEIVLELAPNEVEARRLLTAFESFTKLVRAVVGQEDVEWLASAEKGSQRLRMHTLSDDMGIPLGVERLAHGLTAFNSPGLQAPPEGFGPSETQQLLKLCKAIHRIPGGGNIKIGRQSTYVTDEYIANVERIRQLGYTEIGSLEGTLDAINVHKTNKLTLYRYGHHANVSITFPDDKFEKVRRAVKRRVIIRGRIDYDLAHRIKGGELLNLWVVPESSELPSVASVVGILRDDR